MAAESPFHLFEATGVELELMIVDADSLDVMPIADRVLGAAGGSGEVEVDLGEVAWSNELALHVVEIKTNGPVSTLDGVDRLFADSVSRIETILADHGARLMPSAMHPWMDPVAELRLWPHEAGPIYRAFDRIFDCRGHGWANLQSLHLNFPFVGDEEFRRLHAAVRLLLPILPALAASSPVVDGRPAGALDARMIFYRHNADRIPSVAGAVVPERVWSREAYERELLGGIYADLEPLDPEGVLRHEWVNARGAIARFDRGAIELRVLDTQERPTADIAVAGLLAAALRDLVDERTIGVDEQTAWEESRLAEVLWCCVERAEQAPVDPELARAFGWEGGGAPEAGALWSQLYERAAPRLPARHREALELILDRGTLARRIRRALGDEFDRARLRSTYGELCDCLSSDRPFVS